VVQRNLERRTSIFPRCNGDKGNLMEHWLTRVIIVSKTNTHGPSISGSNHDSSQKRGMTKTLSEQPRRICESELEKLKHQ